MCPIFLDGKRSNSLGIQSDRNENDFARIKDNSDYYYPSSEWVYKKYFAGGPTEAFKAQYLEVYSLHFTKLNKY